jgi:hypothetical protein
MQGGEENWKARQVMRVLLLVTLMLALSGCGGAWMYQASGIEDQIKLIEATGGSGCLYVRGNARPYADVSMLAVTAYGKDAPKYLDCLKAIPPEARSILQLP